MREFFKKEVLDRTYEIFGVWQTDEEKMSDDDITFLLDGLCQVSKNYEYIPQEEQKKIIRACMLKDKTYRNINLRLVAGWLEENGKKYFVEIAHKPITSNDKDYRPLEGEARSKAIDEYLAAIAKAETNFTTALSKGRGAQMRENLDNAGIIKYNAIPVEESALNEYLTNQANGTTSDKEGIPGTDQDSKVSEGSPTVE